MKINKFKQNSIFSRKKSFLEVEIHVAGSVYGRNGAAGGLCGLGGTIITASLAVQSVIITRRLSQGKSGHTKQWNPLKTNGNQ